MQALRFEAKWTSGKIAENQNLSVGEYSTRHVLALNTTCNDSMMRVGAVHTCSIHSICNRPTTVLWNNADCRTITAQTYINHVLTPVFWLFWYYESQTQGKTCWVMEDGASVYWAKPTKYPLLPPLMTLTLLRIFGICWRTAWIREIHGLKRGLKLDKQSRKNGIILQRARSWSI